MNIFISVCDYSSELYAEKLLENLSSSIDGKIFVIGGQVLKSLSLKNSNIEFWLDAVKYSSVGFFENLESIPFIYLDYLKLKNFINKNVIDLAILFDAPAINLRLIKLLKEKGSKIIYIIPPKTWSLDKTNVHKFVMDNCDAVIVPFKFNLKTYDSKNVFYFGHPIVDVIDPNVESNLNPRYLGIFPGSRKFEVNFISKPVFDLIGHLSNDFEKIFISSTSITDKYLKEKNNLNKFAQKLTISMDYYFIVRNVGLALAVSGTVILKNAVFLLPTICFYKVYKISEFIFRKIKKIKVDKIALPNILWSYEFEMNNGEIIPELIQENYNKDNLVKIINQMIENYELYVEKLRIFRKKFFEFYTFGAIKRISEFIKDFISKKIIIKGLKKEKGYVYCKEEYNN